MIVGTLQVPTSEGQALAGQRKAIFFETSAKTGVNVRELFMAIADLIPIPKERRQSELESSFMLHRRESVEPAQPKTCKCTS